MRRDVWTVTGTDKGLVALVVEGELIHADKGLVEKRDILPVEHRRDVIILVKRLEFREVWRGLRRVR